VNKDLGNNIQSGSLLHCARFAFLGDATILLTLSTHQLVALESNTYMRQWRATTPFLQAVYQLLSRGLDAQHPATRVLALCFTCLVAAVQIYKKILMSLMFGLGNFENPTGSKCHQLIIFFSMLCPITAKCENWNQWYRNPRCQVARVTKFVTVTPNICLSSASCHPSGTQNFEVASKFLYTLCPPDLKYNIPSKFTYRLVLSLCPIQRQTTDLAGPYFQWQRSHEFKHSAYLPTTGYNVIPFYVW
jgi:hypothetical protein